MTATIIDPYHGRSEHWPISLLNAASQRASIIFVNPAVRAMPRRDQITFPDRAHFEICGPDELCCRAFACNLIRDVDAAIHDAIAWIEARGTNIATSGTGVADLTRYSAHRGWRVKVDQSTPSGDLDMQLFGQGLVGLTALNTAYGTGPAWNDLHPQPGGNIGHWEGIGAVDASNLEERAMGFSNQDIANAFARVGFVISKNTNREPTGPEQSFWAGKRMNTGDTQTHGSVDLMLATIIDQSGGPK